MTSRQWLGPVYVDGKGATPVRVNDMCESTVFLRDGGEEKVLMKDVAVVRPRDGKLLLTSVFGDRLEVEGVVSELDLMGHRIVVEKGPPRSHR